MCLPWRAEVQIQEVQTQCVEMGKFLLGRGADINALNDFKLPSSPLRIAVKAVFASGSMEFISMIFQCTEGKVTEKILGQAIECFVGMGAELYKNGNQGASALVEKLLRLFVKYYPGPYNKYLCAAF